MSRRLFRLAVACSAMSIAMYAAPVATAGGPTGAQPDATASATGLIYLPMYNDGAVQVIDPVQGKVVKTIEDVGSHPIVVKLTPDGSRLFVGNFGPLPLDQYGIAHVTVIDTRTLSIIKQVETVGAPYAVQQLSHDGRYLYVPTATSLIHLIDTQTLEIAKTFYTPIPAIHLEVAPDDKSFYVLSSAGTIEQFDADTGLPMNLPIGTGGTAPGWGTQTRDGSTIYAINFFDSVGWVDTRTWQTTKSVWLPLGASPLSATLTPDESELWVCNVGTNDITILDARTGEQRGRITTENSPAYVGFSSDGRTAYVSDLGSPSRPEGLVGQWLKYDYIYFLPPGGRGYLNVYDTASREQTGSIETGGYPVAGVYP